MRIAIVLTVKNEERLLRNNLLYHKMIGVEKVYVYFDGTTDNGKVSIQDLDSVEIKNSVATKDFKHLPFLEKFTTQAAEHHTGRQCLNTFDASQKAEKEGYNWLISLDADELLVTRENEVPDLKSFFKKISPEFNAVRFTVREVLQAKKYYQNVFAEETRFKTKRHFRKYYKNIFKKIYNPNSGKYDKYLYWYGHHAGKMAIRLNRGLIPLNVHRFTDQLGTKPKTDVKGMLLHYHSFDATDFVKKYENFNSHPNTYLSGRKVEKLKLLLIAVVNKSGMTSLELEDYFERNLMFKEKEILKLWRNRVWFFLKRETPVLTEITAVQKTFKEILR